MRLPIEPYRPRLTRSLGHVRRDGWAIKLIGISATQDLPGEAERAAALCQAAASLPLPRDGRVAFVVVHHGEDALWVIVAWWNVEILHTRTFRADLGTTDLRPMPSSTTACVWELLAIDHERRAWVEHVLARPGDPDFAGYLADSLDVPAPQLRSNRTGKPSFGEGREVVSSGHS